MDVKASTLLHYGWRKNFEILTLFCFFMSFVSARKKGTWVTPVLKIYLERENLHLKKKRKRRKRFSSLRRC